MEDSQQKGPIVLVADNDPDRKPLLYACPKCGSVYSPSAYLCPNDIAHETAKKAAEDCYNCRTHNVCECGAECSKHWTSCAECRTARKIENSIEVPDDGGPYFEIGGDRHYHEIDDARDDGLEWVHPSRSETPRVDPESILDSLLSDMHEDADIYDLNGVEEFEAACASFNDAQTCVSFWPDGTRKIRVPDKKDELEVG